MKWTGDRIPAPNPLREAQKADASWTRAGIRVDDYMATDMQNPPKETEWWMAYTPSEEEIEAAAAGFDFSNPEKWLEENKGKAPIKLEDQPHEFVMSTGMNYGGDLFPEYRTEITVP